MSTFVSCQCPVAARQLLCSLGVGLAVSFITVEVQAQELVPRAFWPSPVGTNVLSLSYQRSQGDIVTDQSLPVSAVDSENDYLQLSYQRSFDLAGRTATGTISLPLTDGLTTGEFLGQSFSRRTTGAGDTTARLAVNLFGAPAMDRAGFAALLANPGPIIGASLSVTAPTGEYDPDRVINIGGNRWVLKPAVGVIYPLTKSWLIESEVSMAVFQDNDEFVNQTREQDPVVNAQFHLIKQLRNGVWAALDANYYFGGRSRIDGARNDDLQRNSRFGATLVYPVIPGHALRVSASTGTITEVGGDFDLFSVTWIHAF
ncbi:MAG: transporter [Congregibacter sp.]|nr:transporter [Congregibacter sp.]